MKTCRYDDDSDDEILLKKSKTETKKNIVTKSKTESITNSILCTQNLIDNEIKNRDITLSQIYLEIGEIGDIDDLIWFTQQIRIKNKHYENDELSEYYDVSENIYKKFIEIKSMDTIEKKLIDKIKNKNNNDNQTILKKIMNTNHSSFVKELVCKKYIENSKNKNSDEYIKFSEYINTLIEIPTTIKNASNIKQNMIQSQLKKIYDSLDASIYGLNDAKEKVMETICGRLLNPSIDGGAVILLNGPMGVGKTLIAECISNAMNLPFNIIQCGSIIDPFMLSGHPYTYVGATPSLFTKALIASGQLNTMILLDEIDKINFDNKNNTNVISVLLHALDKTQNNKFKDNYIPEIPINLSNILFICTSNSTENINPILLNRMIVINLNGYSIDEKIQIATKFLIPKYLKELLFDENEIIFNKQQIEYLITKKIVNEMGMRNIERGLKELFGRLALLKYSNNIEYSFNVKNIKFPLKITNGIIDTIMRNP